MMNADCFPSTAATASQHLTLLSASSGRPLCGEAGAGALLEAAYVDLNDAATRDRVCRACLREWLRSFDATALPAWSRELGVAA